MNSTSAVPPNAPRGRVQFLLLATLFFFPLLLSFGLNYWFPGLKPSGTTNYGQLVNPPQALPPMRLVEAGVEAPADETLFRGRWSYIVTAAGDCDDSCLRALVMSRQVRLAMNEKRSRIQRVLVLGDPSTVNPVAARLAPEHPDLHVVAETDASPVLREFLQPPGAAIYLSDPLGNWMLVYPALTDTQTDFKGLQEDIKKLLRLSRIG
ncbi:hypothetical protein [Panacagrimonas sp.]|uniref:hypothetical protein n=1 Tax=Panacagrimonas sp. TaxID=2480088 RepID=UPI003B515FAF